LIRLWESRPARAAGRFCLNDWFGAKRVEHRDGLARRLWFDPVGLRGTDEGLQSAHPRHRRAPREGLLATPSGRS
jgi:hypothetical protein